MSQADSSEEHQVCVGDDERCFAAHPSESLLQAGQRAGLNLRYGCKNGSCGECIAELKSGQLRSLQHADYAFSAAERARGAFLMCSCAAASDCRIEAYAYRGPEDLPQQTAHARVSRVEKAGPATMLLNLRLPRTEPLRFLAGQAVSLCIDGLAPRCFAVASCPCQGNVLQLHLPVDPADPWQVQAASTLKRGLQVMVKGPVGTFSLEESDLRPLVFVAWDAGFAPIQSMIDHAISLEWPRPMHLVWLAGPPGWHYLENATRAWADSLDNFHAHLLSLDDGPALDRLIDSLPANAAWYLAGHRGQVGELIKRLPSTTTSLSFMTDEDVCVAGRGRRQ